MTARQLNRAVHLAAATAGIDKRITSHGLRHAFATHLLEQKVDSRLLAMGERGVTFRWKDYRAKGKTRHKAMTLSPQVFMRRFLLHVLPGGFHLIRHYGLLANSHRRDNLALARELLHATPPPSGESADDASVAPTPTFVCAHCGHAMVVLKIFLRDNSIRAPPAS